MTIALIDAFLNLNTVANADICNWGLPELFAKTVVFDTSPQAEYSSLFFLYKIAGEVNFFLIYASILLNTCLAADLIFLIRHPFENKNSWVLTYVVLSLTIAAVLVICYFASMSPKWDPLYQTYLYKPNEIVTICTLAVIILYAIVAFGSIIYGLVRLR